jgi:hypothetical protein
MDRSSLEKSLLTMLATLPGSSKFLGDCSTQVFFDHLGFRVGVTDDDVADVVGVWLDKC